MFSSQDTRAATGTVDTLDQVFMLLRLQAQSIVEALPQVRMLDFYTLSAVSVHLSNENQDIHFPISRPTTSSTNTDKKILSQHET